MNHGASESKLPAWAPSGGGEGFATRIVAAVPDSADSVVCTRKGAARHIDVAGLEKRITTGDRVALAQAITLVESRTEQHRVLADELIDRLTPRSQPSIRIGISGVPGAGKSTFIDSLGLNLVRLGRRLAVLSVDPSSPVSGGSILADKTRMDRLAREAGVFIRPSPSGGLLGGVARRTREVIGLCEAAGYDTIIVETVGVGQSEVVVRSMVDCFVLLTIAGTGDELQGMKKGILELAHLVVVNKADGENKVRAESAALELERALRYLDAKGEDEKPKVRTCSALTGEGVAEIWLAVEACIDRARRRGDFDRIRRSQNVSWMNDLLLQLLADRCESNKQLRSMRAAIESEVAEGRVSARRAARMVVDEMITGWRDECRDEAHNRDALFGKKRGVGVADLP